MICRFLVASVATVALLSSATVASAQGEMGVVQGTVTDEQDGHPLVGAVVKLHDPSRGRDFSVTAGKNGRFYKRGIPGAEYQLVVEMEGYKSIQEPLLIASGAEHRFDFKLAKAAPAGALEFAQGFDAVSRGDDEAAVLAFEAAVEKAPDLPEVRVNLALAYLRVKRNEDAVAQLEKAASMVPDQPRPLFQLGGAYVEMGELDKAVHAFETGLALQPDLTDELAHEATVTLGAVYFAQGENDKAIAHFERALAVTPGAAVPTLGLAKAHLSKGEGDRAVALFKQVVASAPGTPEAAQADAFLKELDKGASPEP